MPSLVEINALPAAEAGAAFRRCCGSTRWAEGMTASRPFTSEEQLFARAEECWQGLDREDYLEAFAAHPRIGDMAALRQKFGQAGWEAGEQSGALGVGEDVLQALASGNHDYEARFGHIFIVCATGRTAPQMLALLQARLGNEPDAELRIAAGEQAKITRLRLEKLLTAV